MSHSCRRPNACGMPNSVPYTPLPSCDNPCYSPKKNCGMNHSSTVSIPHHSDFSCHHETHSDKYTHLEYLPVAMAYVPFQKFTTTYDTCYALKVGTIFPDLCKPFCGKRGGMR